MTEQEHPVSQFAIDWDRTYTEDLKRMMAKYPHKIVPVAGGVEYVVFEEINLDDFKVYGEP